MPIKFTFRGRIVTYGAGAWNNRGYNECQQEIREMVAASPDRDQLMQWFVSKTKLSLNLRFYLGGNRCDRNDLDNLLSPFFNPIVWGAYGGRPKGPIIADALFWRIYLTKIRDKDERVEMEIEPILDT